jgi:hypothetical protein
MIDPPESVEDAVPVDAGAQDSDGAPVLKTLISQVASSSTNAGGNGTQSFGHAFRRLTFTDKRIGASGQGGLMTGVQMADEDNDQRSRAGRSKFVQSRRRRIRE